MIVHPAFSEKQRLYVKDSLAVMAKTEAQTAYQVTFPASSIEGSPVQSSFNNNNNNKNSWI